MELKDEVEVLQPTITKEQMERIDANKKAAAAKRMAKKAMDEHKERMREESDARLETLKDTADYNANAGEELTIAIEDLSAHVNHSSAGTSSRRARFNIPGSASYRPHSRPRSSLDDPEAFVAMDAEVQEETAWEKPPVEKPEDPHEPEGEEPPVEKPEDPHEPEEPNPLQAFFPQPVQPEVPVAQHARRSSAR